MNLNGMSLVERAKKILIAPREEWQVIEDEPHTVKDIYTRYVMILAAIPAVAGFIGWSVIGIGVLGQTYRVPIGLGLAHMILTYLLSLGVVYVLALVIDSWAPKFDGQRDFVKALKVSAYSSTAMWLAGIFHIIPALAIFYLLGLYSLYTLFVGLPMLMKTPDQKTLPYTVVVFVTIIVLVVVIRGVAALAIPGQVRGF